jgi:hypothetical protein
MLGKNREREKKIKLKDNNKKNYLIFSEKQNRYDYYEKKRIVMAAIDEKTVLS